MQGGSVKRASHWLPSEEGGKYRVGQKTAQCTSTVSKQIEIQCVPIKLVLSDFNVTHVVSHKHIIIS